MVKFIKQKYGEINQVFYQEEKVMLSCLEKAKLSPNSAIVGKNGEIILLDMLNKHLPKTFRAVHGHFITPDGAMSSEIDIMLIDARYPLLSVNEDGSALVMLHSVITTIEVKSSLSKREIKDIQKNRIINDALAQSYFDRHGSFMQQVAFAYSSNLTLKTVAKHIFTKQDKNKTVVDFEEVDLTLLRIHRLDGIIDKDPLGAGLWLEGAGENDRGTPYVYKTYSPLSDFYYRLIQNSYYVLADRAFDFCDIGQHMMLYYNWGVHSITALEVDI